MLRHSWTGSTGPHLAASGHQTFNCCTNLARTDPQNWAKGHTKVDMFGLCVCVLPAVGCDGGLWSTGFPEDGIRG